MDQATYQKATANYSKAPKTILTSYNFYQLARLINEAVNIAINQRLEGLDIIKKEDKDRLLTITEVTELFQCSKATIYNYKKDERLRGFKKIGNRTYILESDCMACLREIKYQKK